VEGESNEPYWGFPPPAFGHLPRSAGEEV